VKICDKLKSAVTVTCGIRCAIGKVIYRDDNTGARLERKRKFERKYNFVVF
jgi:hypothetical protein